MEASMADRGPDRRWRAHDPARLAPERRDGFDRRAGPIKAAMPGGIRPLPGEAPPRDRRKFPEAG
jgi:hypothetical protein